MSTAEKLLPSASLALSINGTDYVTNKNIISVEFGGKNNIRLDDGFYPGSGFQEAADATGGAVRGRLEFGNREFNLKFVARFQNGSEELTKLKAQTTGSAVITLTYDANSSLAVTFQKVGFSVAEVGDTDGRVTVSVECTPLYNSVNGVIQAVAKCGLDGICQ